MYTIINIPIVVTTCIVYCRYHLSSYKARPVYIKLPPSLINAGRRQWSWLPRITCMEGRELKSQTRWSPPRKGHEKHIIAAVGSPLPKKPRITFYNGGDISSWTVTATVWFDSAAVGCHPLRLRMPFPFPFFQLSKDQDLLLPRNERGA